MAKARKPHKAQISISLMVYDLLADGSLNSTAMTPDEMKAVGLKHQYLVEVEGFDQFEAIKKVKGILNDLKAK